MFLIVLQAPLLFQQGNKIRTVSVSNKLTSAITSAIVQLWRYFLILAAFCCNSPQRILGGGLTEESSKPVHKTKQKQWNVTILSGIYFCLNFEYNAQELSMLLSWQMNFEKNSSRP